jgi:hypothetical protein
MNQSNANHTKVQRLHSLVLCSVQKLTVAKYYTQTNNIYLSVSQHELSDVLNTLRTGEADLRLYITTVQDG